MKKVLKFTFVLLVTLTINNNVFAQERVAHENRLEVYKTKLNLSATQYESIKKILEEWLNPIQLRRM